jgi:hypothetical protein
MGEAYVYEGKTRIYWVTDIEDIEAPTVAELNAGIDVTLFVTKDGLTTPANQNMVDNATIAETFDAQVVGSWGGSLELMLKRKYPDADDTAWNTWDYGDIGFIVVRRAIARATAWANLQKCEVYPAQAHQPVPEKSAANEQVRFKVAFAVTAQPAMKATVAAS